MTSRVCVFLAICSLCAIGCLSRTPEKTATVEATSAASTEPPTVAELRLSLAKPIYSPDEPIPVDLTIQVGKFDLLVPYASVEGNGPFIKLVVKDALGKVVTPKHPITFARKTKILIRKGKDVSCVQGTELKAGTVKKATLENLRTYYELEPGDYTLQTQINLKVYRESLLDQPLQIIEIEREIAAIQRDRKLPADAKQEAISSLREEIEFIRSKAENQSDQIYLPLDSYRGAADLESNIIALTIQ